MGKKRARVIDPTFVETIQNAIRESGMTLEAIGEEAKVSQASLSRFMRNERTITLESANKICNLFGLRLMRPEE